MFSTQQPSDTRRRGTGPHVRPRPDQDPAGGRKGR